MEGIFNIYEPDFYTDLNALTNLAKRISGRRKIKIQYTQTRLIYTNGPYIYLPTKFKKNLIYSQGFIAHESGHIGYGSFELSFINLSKSLSKKYALPQNLVKKIVNVVEDVRIDMINKARFPGFYNYLRKYTLEILPEIKKKMQLYGDILLYINLFMEDYPDFQLKPVFPAKEMEKEDWETIKTMKKLLLKSLTPSTSIIISDQLCKILRKYFKRKKVVVKRTQRSGSHYSSNRSTKHGNRRSSDYVILDEDATPEIKKKEMEEIELSLPKEANKMADPFYIEDVDFERAKPISIFEDGEEFISQMENFSSEEEKKEQSNIEKSSKDTIKALEKNDLSHDDLKELLENLENLEEENQNRKVKCKDFESSLSDFDMEYSFNDELESKEIHIDEIESEYSNDFKQKKDEEEIICIIDGDDDSDKDSLSKSFLDNILDLIEDSNDEMKERFIRLEALENQKMSSDKKYNREVIETNIKDDQMNPINITSKEILEAHQNLIYRVKLIFSTLHNQKEYDTHQNIGRLNKGFIKAITSNYTYKKCFTRKLNQKTLKILLMVDISGSMKGKKLEAAKIAMILLCEALQGIALLRIVLFAGDFDARNILVKDFNENADLNKFDLFGCHQNINSNLDGISLKHEASKLDGNEIIIVISDGQPAGRSYGLKDAEDEIQEVRKRFNVFAFSIDAKGEYLDKLYGKYWILANSSQKTDLGEKLVQFSRIVVKEFFN
ncbi:MAG: hypothetical protein BAJALOKI3v1_480022 [Promethearchaeota archaeon]|nr:MAG: hypothetical protein BAJALOKI3v1_480022 [Candidatus Lokiarchaeota archaeon]